MVHNLCASWHFLPVALIIFTAGYGYAIEPLSDQDLDELTAGAATVTHDSQVGPQGLTGNIDATGTASLSGGIVKSSINQPGEGNEVQVLADSQAELIISQQLRLTNSAQNHSKALNIDNAVASDLANALNISVAGVHNAQTLIQSNDSLQTEHKVASVALSRLASDYRVDKRVKTHTTNHTRNRFQEELQRDFSYRRTERFNSVDVAVDPFDPRLLLGEIKIGTPQIAPLTLISAYTGPCATFADNCFIAGGDIVDALDIFDVLPNRVDYNFGWDETTLKLPEFSASIDPGSLVEKDLNIILTAAPPILDLGAIYFETRAHFNDGPRDPIKLEFDIDLPELPPISVNLPVANPLFGLEMSINTGFALAGKGEIKGSFGGLSGVAQVNVINVLEDIFPLKPIGDAIQTGIDILNAVDFLNVIPDIPGPANLDLQLAISIPIDIDLTPDDLEQTVSGDVEVVTSESPFHFRYDGVFCFELFGDGQCGSVENVTTTTTVEDHSFTSEHSEQMTFLDSFSDNVQQVVSNGSQLSGGEAEKIVLQGSELVTIENSLIQLSSQSQKNLSSLNVTNASATISANSLNIQSMRTNRVGPTQISALRLQQSNRFIQLR